MVSGESVMEQVPEWFIQNLTAEELVEASSQSNAIDVTRSKPHSRVRSEEKHCIRFAFGHVGHRLWQDPCSMISPLCCMNPRKLGLVFVYPLLLKPRFASIHVDIGLTFEGLQEAPE